MGAWEGYSGARKDKKGEETLCGGGIGGSWFSPAAGTCQEIAPHALQKFPDQHTRVALGGGHLWWDLGFSFLGPFMLGPN